MQVIATTDYRFVNRNKFDSIDPDKTGFFLDSCAEECYNLGLSITHYFKIKETDELIGFITLSAHRLELYSKSFRNDLTLPDNKKDHVPMIKIDQIAVSKPHQRKGYGDYILSYAINMVKKEIKEKIGSRYLFCEIYNDERNIPFFERKFVLLNSDWTKKPTRKFHQKHNMIGAILDLYADEQ